jgi:hypothetical protein
MLHIEFMKFCQNHWSLLTSHAEAEAKEKHGVWNSMPELTITSPHVHSRVDSNTFTMGNPCLSQFYLLVIVRDLGFGLWKRMDSALPSTKEKS